MNSSLVLAEPLSVLVPLLVLVLVFFILVRGIKTGDIRRTRARTESAGPSATEVLDRRHAIGELSREEYLKIRDDISRDENAR